MRRSHDERALWDAGISTRFVKKLTTKDIKEYIELYLGLKCGKVCRGNENASGGIKFLVKDLSFFEKNSLKKSGEYNEFVQCGKSVFEAYDYGFVFFTGERVIYNSDKQLWIDFMSKKFGKEYDDFQCVYTDEL